MTDIMLDLTRLSETRDGLAASIEAFRTAAGFTNQLEDAVDRPDDRRALQGKVHDFESDWNGRRESLEEAITDIHEHLVAIIDGWEQWDVEATRAFDECAVPPAASGGGPQAAHV